MRRGRDRGRMKGKTWHRKKWHRLVRLIAGNPVTMGEMTRHVADAGSYAPVTILVEEMPGGATRVAYDTVARAMAPYQDPAAAQVAERLDAGCSSCCAE